MNLLLPAQLAQAADAATFALGMATIVPVELSPLAALGPGPVLLAKAGAMALLLVTRDCWGWRIAAAVALVVGTIGVAANLRVLMA
jgi:hypothetical protein